MRLQQLQDFPAVSKYPHSPRLSTKACREAQAQEQVDLEPVAALFSRVVTDVTWQVTTLHLL